MPQLTFRGIEKKMLQHASKDLVLKLASLCDCAPDSFTLDLLETVTYHDGEEVPTYPFVEVGWFDRGQDAKDQFAKIVYESLKALGNEEIEIAFTSFEKVSYYTNEKHYG